jgi:succinate dehydrogenase / fumarate reductase iron-sulfur subunit
MIQPAPRWENLGPRKSFSVTLKVWRQNGPESDGWFETFRVDEVNPDMSFLEMLDCLNDRLMLEGKDPIAFDHDCREGICGTCGVMINGQAHGPIRNMTTCQIRMRIFKEGDVLVLEPFRAKAFPVVKDLVVDRSALDRIQQAGGYVSVNVGGAPEANSILVPKKAADAAMRSAACIGCGACVAACKNSSAALFTGAKISHLASLPQGQAERRERALSMVARMDLERAGHQPHESRILLGLAGGRRIARSGASWPTTDGGPGTATPRNSPLIARRGTCAGAAAQVLRKVISLARHCLSQQAW